MLLLADDDYMKMKLESFKRAHQPVRFVKQLDRVVQNYKPVANHKNLVRKFLHYILTLPFFDFINLFVFTDRI